MRFVSSIRVKPQQAARLGSIVIACAFLAMPMAHAQFNTELLALSAPTSSAEPVPVAETDINVAEQYLFAAANQERAARGLAPLHMDLALSQASALHAAQMADHEDITHQFSGEPDLEDRGANAGVRFSLIAENVGEAPTSVILQNLWMNSPDHRANLLDPEVDAVGIAVIQRDDELYAVEDFASTVAPLSLDQQENAVASVLTKEGMSVGGTMSATARITCAMPSGYVGVRRPQYIMRFTASSLSDLPVDLKVRLSSGKFHQAVVGACSDQRKTAFTAYNIAVLLYP